MRFQESDIFSEVKIPRFANVVGVSLIQPDGVKGRSKPAESPCLHNVCGFMRDKVGKGSMFRVTHGFLACSRRDDSVMCDVGFTKIGICGELGIDKTTGSGLEEAIQPHPPSRIAKENTKPLF